MPAPADAASDDRRAVAFALDRVSAKLEGPNTMDAPAPVWTRSRLSPIHHAWTSFGTRPVATGDEADSAEAGCDAGPALAGDVIPGVCDAPMDGCDPDRKRR